MRARLITQEAPKFSFFVTPTKVLAFAKGIFGTPSIASTTTRSCAAITHVSLSI
jgi:hypothetical protein